MNLHEKLERLTEDRNKAAVSRRAGLPMNAMSDYLNKGHRPSVGKVFRIARALFVSVEWLLDDSRGWPPVWVNAPPQQASAGGGDSVESEPAGAIAAA
jgi:transcriptional regulator with XRE-family HTH domain